MILPRKEDAKHKYQLYRLLSAILENNYLSNTLFFKGGTYAALRGVLSRFSIDLDFDLIDKGEQSHVRQELEKIFDKLDLSIKDQSREHLQFFLRYEAKEGERNTLKLEITDIVSPENKYEVVSLSELQLSCHGQTLSTMVANKMYAATARYNKTGHIAGRDFYDLLVFLREGLNVRREVVEERSGEQYGDYIEKLITFVKKELSDDELYQDLNALLPATEMRKVVKYLKRDLLILLNDEFERSNNGEK